MHFQAYAFNCRFGTAAQLPEYKGSTFRGVFGRALKQVICALKRQECDNCLLKCECLYPQVFEPHLTVAPDAARNGNDPPHPYVIQPPDTEKTTYQSGDLFTFNLLLLGSVNSRLSYFIYALDEMGRIGVGRKIAGRRGAYCLEQVTVGDHTIYTHDDRRLRGVPPPLDLATVPSDPHLPASADHVTLNLHTPLRIKHNNRLSPDLPFHVLTRAMLRRCSTLSAHFDGAEPDLDYTGLVQRAHEVRSTGSTLRWVDHRRYSLRQDQAMMMGGLLGTITYTGDLGPYLPLLDYCSRVHLGKQTTFGLGRISVEVGR